MENTELGVLQRAVQANPADAEARLALLRGLIDAARWPEAEALARALLQEMEPPPEVHGALGLVLGKQGRWAEAAQQCQQALAGQPDDALALFNLSLAQARQGDLEAALAGLNTVVTLEPAWAEAHYSLGTLLLQQQRYHEALQALERAGECRSPYPEAQFNRGNAHALRGLDADGSLNYYELDCAINAYKMAIQQRPGYTAALYNLGMVYQRMGSAEGLRVWEQYLEAAATHLDEDTWRARAQAFKEDLAYRLR
ncbi:MAG: tetratricopeptide repeat protein [Candidatus Tectimicrobiota bacterium]